MLSLTGTDIQPGHLDKCHRLHKESTVIIEFKERTSIDSVLRGRKNYKNQIKNLADLGLQKSFVTESLCTEYKRLAFICRMLKKGHHIYQTWFFNGRLFIVKVEGGIKTQINHIDNLNQLFSEELILKICSQGKNK